VFGKTLAGRYKGVSLLDLMLLSENGKKNKQKKKTGTTFQEPMSERLCFDYVQNTWP